MYRVLLVDDEPATMETEYRTIKKKLPSFEVVGEAYSVDEAIRLYEEFQPHVILTDMKMPGKNGIELIHYVVNKENNKTICIAVSGYADFDYVHDAFLNGAYDYLLKPVNPKKLAALLQKVSQVLAMDFAGTDKPARNQKNLTGKKLLEEIDRYLKKNLHGDNSIAAICGAFSINQPYLSKVFKQYYNCTYNEYLIELKIEEAKRLLSDEEEEYRIGEIAEVTGFSDQFYFSKVFKNITGMSPREYRNNLRIPK